MEDLFELFLKEKRYLADVTEKSLLFYKGSYSALKRSLEGEISKQSFNQLFPVPITSGFRRHERRSGRMGLAAWYAGVQYDE